MFLLFCWISKWWHLVSKTVYLYEVCYRKFRFHFDSFQVLSRFVLRIDGLVNFLTSLKSRVHPRNIEPSTVWTIRLRIKNYWDFILKPTADDWRSAHFICASNSKKASTSSRSRSLNMVFHQMFSMKNIMIAFHKTTGEVFEVLSLAMTSSPEMVLKILLISRFSGLLNSILRFALQVYPSYLLFKLLK